jgi:hypothetical protein
VLLIVVVTDFVIMAHVTALMDGEEQIVHNESFVQTIVQVMDVAKTSRVHVIKDGWAKIVH